MKYLLSFTSGLAGAIFFTLLYNYTYHQSIGVVRMDEIVGSHIEAQGINEMTTVQAEEKARRFSVALERTVKEVSDEYRVLLLVNPAVVSSAPDYTDIIKQRISKRLDSNG